MNGLPDPYDPRTFIFLRVPIATAMKPLSLHYRLQSVLTQQALYFRQAFSLPTHESLLMKWIRLFSTCAERSTRPGESLAPETRSGSGSRRYTKSRCNPNSVHQSIVGVHELVTPAYIVFQSIAQWSNFVAVR